MSLDDFDALAGRLIETLRSEEVTLFVGAGVSLEAPADLPTTMDLKWRVLKVVAGREAQRPAAEPQTNLSSVLSSEAEQPSLGKRRLPSRHPEPLTVPAMANGCWSMDFMSDALMCGRRFRTFNVLDDFNREELAIEIDLSLPAPRVIRVLERVALFRGKRPVGY